MVALRLDVEAGAEMEPLSTVLCLSEKCSAALPTILFHPTYF